MKNLLPKSLAVSIIFLQLFASSVHAHGGEEETAVETVTQTLEDSLRSNSIKIVVVASILILGFLVLTIFLKHLGERVKTVLFLGIVLPTLFTTVYLITSTISLNSASSSGGPVHWHADFEIWDCGQKLELTDPEGFSNRVGSATFHEHNDNRIHVEGVVVDKKEAALGRFFQFVGGELHNDGFQIPTNDGLIVRRNGDPCKGDRPGILQAFVYKTHGDTYRQEKLTDPTSYILSPYGNVPPGDCIVVEFDSKEKEKTDRLCDSYELKIKTSKGTFHGD
ncbi:MAG: hypothetical protein A2Z42_03560 [Candidatus Woykebacteria bacterium RBG_19FT_COMBO_43_10]|uniref:Uncharacterized protein n=1 Tax=Candidatus Woykebacteria bacterium RBG_19FT_COMBO_43_10 TaxID=1802598 RepID=A0A1G1WIR5_9BACT|nr:MAG: hypothetical protein A2Z42_03560 [Candidatus Woykebacteria bacterium RBG_19FT_COMBO_43_10]